MEQIRTPLDIATEALVESLNPEWQNDPDMKGTPERLSKMYKHFFRNEDVKLHFEKKFPTDNDQMIIVKDIECVGTCPHHFVPIIYKVHIGYIPNKYALGLSKFARIAIALSSHPKLQENFTKEIARSIDENLETNGVMVVVCGIHGCMRCRGVQQVESSTITSAVSGAFKMNAETRAEFLSLTGRK